MQQRRVGKCSHGMYELLSKQNKQPAGGWLGKGVRGAATVMPAGTQCVWVLPSLSTHLPASTACAARYLQTKTRPGAKAEFASQPSISKPSS